MGSVGEHHVLAGCEALEAEGEVLAAVGIGLHHGLPHGVDHDNTLDGSVGFKHHAVGGGVGVEAELAVGRGLADAQQVAEEVALGGIHYLAVVDVVGVIVVDEGHDFAVLGHIVVGEGVGEGNGEFHVAAFHAEGVAPHVGDSVAHGAHVPVVDIVAVAGNAVVIVVLLHEDAVFHHEDDDAGAVGPDLVAKAAADGAGDLAGGGVVGNGGGVDLAVGGHFFGLCHEGADGGGVADIAHGACVAGVEACAVQHHSRCEGAAAVEDGEGFVDVVGEVVGAEAGMVLDPDDVVVAVDHRVDAVGAGGAVAALGGGELLNEDFAGESLLGVLGNGCHGGKH